MTYILLNNHTTDNESWTRGDTVAYTDKDKALSAYYAQCKAYMDNDTVLAWCVSIIDPTTHKRLYTQSYSESAE